VNVAPLSIDLFRLITRAQKCRSHALCVGKSATDVEIPKLRELQAGGMRRSWGIISRWWPVVMVAHEDLL
jgi:hypothetical protein